MPQQKAEGPCNGEQPPGEQSSGFAAARGPALRTARGEGRLRSDSRGGNAEKSTRMFGG